LPSTLLAGCLQRRVDLFRGESRGHDTQADVVGEPDGIVTVAVECLPMHDTSNGIVSAVAKCNVDGIG